MSDTDKEQVRARWKRALSHCREMCYLLRWYGWSEPRARRMKEFIREMNHAGQEFEVVRYIGETVSDDNDWVVVEPVHAT